MTTILAIMTLEQSDAAHGRDPECQGQEKGKAIMAVELHLGQEIGQSDEEKSAGREGQGRTGELTLHIFSDSTLSQLKGDNPHRYHEREADLNEPNHPPGDTFAGQDRGNGECIRGLVQNDRQKHGQARKRPS